MRSKSQAPAQPETTLARFGFPECNLTANPQYDWPPLISILRRRPPYGCHQSATMNRNISKFFRLHSMTVLLDTCGLGANLDPMKPVGNFGPVNRASDFFCRMRSSFVALYRVCRVIFSALCLVVTSTCACRTMSILDDFGRMRLYRKRATESEQLADIAPTPECSGATGLSAAISAI